MQSQTVANQVVLPPGCAKVNVSGKNTGIAVTAPPPTDLLQPPGQQAFGYGVPSTPTPAQAKQAQQQFAALQSVAKRAQDHTLHTLEVESALALGLMAVASLGLGWLVAGRVLRPIHRITNTARRLSQETLHERINLDRPNDELKELADTFDAMLARLDQAFTSQRRFVANASHELRTPLATERVLIDEALANHEATTEDLRSILEQLRFNSEESEALIDALLVLARSERGVERWLATDLAERAGDVIAQARSEAITRGVTVQTDLEPATTAGDPALLERLVGNLVQNGIRHNLLTNGWLKVTTGAARGAAEIAVANSGPVLAPEHLPALLEPFRRHRADRTTTDGGLGLGLSIVKSIVDAHGGRLEMTAPEAGGLRVTVSLAASTEPAYVTSESDVRLGV
jgi:signal transduction histidine kinase